MENDALLARRYYTSMQGSGAELFLDRENCCPWCGSRNLVARLYTVDLIQRKRGEFMLDACRQCTHVFQNPRLSSEGLGYYYRDFYDGLGKQRMSTAFASRGRIYHQRARAVHTLEESPSLWLDVGAGHGHFCESAKTVFPQTQFHGSDSSDGIEDALCSKRIERAFREPLSILSQQLKHSYDVVSMYHYLEHTTAPKEELGQAAMLLKPGGLLVIEVPNLDCPMSRWLGRYWLPWLQPQHLHFVPVENLIAELTSLGFDIELCDHAGPHDPIDLSAAVMLWLNEHLPPTDTPWRNGSRSAASRMLRNMVLASMLPLLVAARVLDLTLAGPLLKAFGRGNAYRLIARKR